ncbi:uncharacterized protein LOC108913452 [Anoplophora glabripennis]|uniref:uncharacterized protein LOC108913452 n=1 Tax=Anoplophora glabripennis TaxID=217634 RepID=UPI000873CA39|nr:uncharacterized protein LOC108913452 [Anoplophora glabripennis]
MSNIKEVVVNELHKPARKNFRRHVLVRGLNDLIQADLVETIPYPKVNKGYRYILVVINVFSKFVWAEPVNRKTAKEVSNAMAKILSQMKYMPHNCQTDLGKKFYNKEFKNLMTQFKINHYSTYSNLKASVVERGYDTHPPKSDDFPGRPPAGVVAATSSSKEGSNRIHRSDTK